METQGEGEEVNTMEVVNLGEGNEPFTEGEVTTYTFKVLVIGEPNVGKSSFVTRYVDNKFEFARTITRGVDFRAHEFDWDAKTKVRLHFWDVAGQETLGTQTKIYFRDARGAFVVYDAKDANSRIMITQWKMHLDRMTTLNGEPYAPPAILLCNKIDLVVKKSDEFDVRDLQVLCMDNKFDDCLPISNLSSYNIGPAIKKLVKIMLDESKRLDLKDPTFPLDSHIPEGDGGVEKVVITDAPEGAAKSRCGC
jgi:small GTP-binding protein